MIRGKPHRVAPRIAERALACMILAGFLPAASPARAGDWPQWRYDAGHTAATSEKLSDAFHVQWVRHLPPQEPAWRDEAILQYDAGYTLRVA